MSDPNRVRRRYDIVRVCVGALWRTVEVSSRRSRQSCCSGADLAVGLRAPQKPFANLRLSRNILLPNTAAQRRLITPLVMFREAQHFPERIVAVGHQLLKLWRGLPNLRT